MHCGKAMLRAESPEIKCAGCGSRILVPRPDGARAQLRMRGKSLIASGSNNPVRWGRHPFQYENSSDPLLGEFAAAFNLKKAFRNAENEFQALVNLRHLARTEWFPRRPAPVFLKKYGLWTCSRNNSFWFCTHQSRMFVLCATALGFPARIINVARGVGLNDDCKGHMVSDVWCNEFQKWVYFDNLLDFHYQDRAGAPLSLLEARDLFFRKNRKGLYVSGLIDFEGLKPGIYNLGAKNPCAVTKEFIDRSLNMFWCVFYHGNNYFSMPLEKRQVRLLLYEDDLTMGRKFFGGGYEHYTDEPMLFRTSNTDDVCPAMNNAEIQLYLTAGTPEKVQVYIAANSPNLKSIRYRLNGSAWRTYRYDGFVLPGQRRTVIEAVTENRFGVKSAISAIRMEYK